MLVHSIPLFIVDALLAQTYTSVRIPQLTTRYSVHNDGLALGTPVGFAGRGQQQAEDNALHVHVQGINAVVRF